MMAPHYIWIKPHLLLIAQALENTLQDDIATVRHRAARCLDIVAHSISTHLIAQSNVKSAEFEADVEMALLFWSKMLQIVTEQLQDVEQSATTKSIFCDAYSNIGVHVYERLPVSLTSALKVLEVTIITSCLFSSISAPKANTDYLAVVWFIAG